MQSFSQQNVGGAAEVYGVLLAHSVIGCIMVSALNLDPKNAPAQEGLQKIEQCTDGGTLEVTYGLDEMEEMNSDEADLEESETEAVWSDGDLNLAASVATPGRYL